MTLSLAFSETLFAFALYFGLRSLVRLSDWIKLFWSRASPLKVLSEFRDQLHFIRDSLKSGQFPGSDAFEKSIKSAPEQFQFSLEVILELRSQGAPILPSLDRLLQSVDFQYDLIRKIQVKSAPAKAQAFVMIGMIPVFSGLLLALFPPIRSEYQTWAGVTAVALVFGMCGSYWIWAMIQKALRGGMTPVVCSQVRGFATWMSVLEAEVFRGVSPDVAWTNAFHRIFSEGTAPIAGLSSQVWDEPALKLDLIRPSVIAIQKAIQLSLMEGRPSLDRIGTAISDFQGRTRSLIFRELEVLPTRVLMPLFVTLAPAVMLLLGAALFLMMEGDEWKLFV